MRFCTFSSNEEPLLGVRAVSHLPTNGWHNKKRRTNAFLSAPVAISVLLLSSVVVTIFIFRTLLLSVRRAIAFRLPLLPHALHIGPLLLQVSKIKRILLSNPCTGQILRPSLNLFPREPTTMDPGLPRHTSSQPIVRRGPPSALTSGASIGRSSSSPPRVPFSCASSSL